MDLMRCESFILSEAKSMASSLCGAISTPTLLQTPKALLPSTLLGLKDLISPETQLPLGDQPIIVHSYSSTARVWSPPETTLPNSSFFRSSTIPMDEWIGTDSGVDMASEDEEQTQANNKIGISKRHNYFIRDKRRHKECYPPAITSPATTRAYSEGMMTWQWTRHRHGGRLVLEGRVSKRNEYFEARREDGRLILTLVALEDHDHGDDDHRGIIISGDSSDDEDDDDGERSSGMGLETSGEISSAYNNHNSCGIMFMDSVLLCKKSNDIPISSPSIVRPLTSVIV